MTSNQTTMMLKALCPEPDNYSRAGLEAVRAFADLDAEPLGREELLERVGEYDILLIRLKTFVDEAVLARAHRLKAIVSPTTGLNHIDVESAEGRGIRVFHLRGQVDFLRTVTSTAEHAWALLLALVRRMPAATSDVLAGHWRQDVNRGTELSGKRLGILGFGRLGQIVARYGDAFGMDVYAFDTSLEQAPEWVSTKASLRELLAVSDVVSIHVPLNEETTRLIGRSELADLPDGAVLINTSRGEIIDEQALLDALESGRLAGAAVDVIANENAFSANPLIAYAKSHSNLIITPHIGGATHEAVEKTDLFIVRQLASWLEGQS